MTPGRRTPAAGPRRTRGARCRLCRCCHRTRTSRLRRSPRTSTCLQIHQRPTRRLCRLRPMRPMRPMQSRGRCRQRRNRHRCRPRRGAGSTTRAARSWWSSWASSMWASGPSYQVTCRGLREWRARVLLGPSHHRQWPWTHVVVPVHWSSEVQASLQTSCVLQQGISGFPTQSGVPFAEGSGPGGQGVDWPDWPPPARRARCEHARRGREADAFRGVGRRGSARADSRLRG